MIQIGQIQKKEKDTPTMPTLSFPKEVQKIQIHSIPLFSFRERRKKDEDESYKKKRKTFKTAEKRHRRDFIKQSHVRLKYKFIK